MRIVDEVAVEKKAINSKTLIIIGIVMALLAMLGVVGYTISRDGADREESLLEFHMLKSMGSADFVSAGGELYIIAVGEDWGLYQMQ